MLLLKDINIDDIQFKSMRRTDTGTRIIDVDNQKMYQTCWLKALYDIEYNLCLSTEGIEPILEMFDKKVIEESIKSFDFSEKDITDMYKYLNKNYISLSISTNTYLFDKDKNCYEKPEIKDKLKKGDFVRCIIKPKKIYYKDHEIVFTLELVQIELS